MPVARARVHVSRSASLVAAGSLSSQACARPSETSRHAASTSMSIRTSGGTR